jgi:serine/threonine protein kinase
LLPGTLLHSRYIVGVALGVGGFGITYKCLDIKIGGICAIKEYFPANFALRTNATKFVSVAEQNLERYNKIMKRFVEEAELVKSLHHRNVITIYDSFFENNTAYYVMEYCDGIDLRRYTNNFSRKLEYDEGMNLLYQIMNGLEYIHSKGILHRDIAPDNIYVTKNNSVKILDFGSARRQMEQFNRELSVIVKVGYAPIEQYGGHGKQGPYTDIYALGATFYHLFTSKIPIESTQRVAEDNLEEFSRLRPDLPDNLKYCIEKSMELTIAKRISSIAEMKRILGLNNKSLGSGKSEEPVKPPHVKVEMPVQHKTNTARARGNVHVASIGMRIGAYAIDLLLWAAIYNAVLFGIFGDNSIRLGILFPIVFTLINTIFELTTSATIGKLILHIYIRGKTDAELMPSQVLLRNIVKLLGIFVIVFAQNGELLEDRLTNSIVCIKEWR